MIKDYFLISDAAHMVEVESHVLRYWEDELGHRYYTNSDIDRFKRIRELKKQGLQLKAIRMLLKDGKLSVGTYCEKEEIADTREMDSKEEKTKRLQWLLQQIIAEAVKSSNQELCKEIKDSLVKELDYQFRKQEERDDMRERERVEREDEHFKKIDELLRTRSKRWKK